MNNLKRPLVVIAGPTAVGKSETAAELGRMIGGEIVSADSMQVYRHMDIGSAKVTYEEMLGVPHHMIDVVEPTEEMDVARYAEMAGACIQGIHERGRIPILCGGTGFYIQAVTRAIDFEETGPDEDFRREMAAFADRNGAEALYDRLLKVDPEAALQIHPHNIRRVIRALEYYKESGQKISEHNNAEKQKESPYDLAFYVIHTDRQKLYDRIDSRVDFMFAEGLRDEVIYLKAMGLSRDHVSMQGLGYKEILDELDNLTTPEETVRILKRDTRHYAKRQLTWFGREKDAEWIRTEDFGDQPLKIAEYLKEELIKRGIVHEA